MQVALHPSVKAFSTGARLRRCRRWPCRPRRAWNRAPLPAYSRSVSSCRGWRQSSSKLFHTAFSFCKSCSVFSARYSRSQRCGRLAQTPSSTARAKLARVRGELLAVGLHGGHKVDVRAALDEPRHRGGHIAQRSRSMWPSVNQAVAVPFPTVLSMESAPPSSRPPFSKTAGPARPARFAW